MGPAVNRICIYLGGSFSFLTTRLWKLRLAFWGQPGVPGVAVPVTCCYRWNCTPVPQPPVIPGRRGSFQGCSMGCSPLPPVFCEVYCTVQKDAFLLWVCCFLCHPPEAYVLPWDNMHAGWDFLYFWVSVLDPKDRKLGKTPPCDNRGEKSPGFSPGAEPWAAHLESRPIW